MSTEPVLSDPALEALRKKLFPRIPWTAEGPVRRRYRAKAAAEGRTVAGALEALALSEGFLAPGGRTVTGGAAQCLEAFRRRGTEDVLVFGQGLDAVWCDLALGPADADGWQEMLVRSEEAENLVALAHARGAVRFRKI